MQTQRYLVNSPIKLRGRIARLGDVVEFNAVQATLLVRSGVLTLIPEQPAEASGSDDPAVQTEVADAAAPALVKPAPSPAKKSPKPRTKKAVAK